MRICVYLAKKSKATTMGRGIDLIYTIEMKRFINDRQYGISRKELTMQFNQVFGTEYSINNISAYCKRNGLRNGSDGRFIKGQQPHNKGTKMSKEVYEKAKHTMFKKGIIPHNHKPVESERVNVDGYIEIKIAEPNKWRGKHNVVWEQHNGAIPKGYVVVFLDRNQLNIDISNLKLIKRSELLIMNRYGLYGEDAEINNAATNLAKLIDTTNKAKRV